MRGATTLQKSSLMQQSYSVDERDDPLARSQDNHPDSGVRSDARDALQTDRLACSKSRSLFSTNIHFCRIFVSIGPCAKNPQQTSNLATTTTLLDAVSKVIGQPCYSAACQEARSHAGKPLSLRRSFASIRRHALLAICDRNSSVHTS